MALLERAAKESSAVQRAAAAVVHFCGTATFVWLHLAWFASWVTMNLLAQKPLDPYPFTFLTLIVSLEAILMSAFILNSQDQEARLADRLNKLDLQINLLSEQKNTRMLQMLEQIAHHLGLHDLPGDPATSVLEEAMKPERLIEQIERASRR